MHERPNCQAFWNGTLDEAEEILKKLEVGKAYGFELRTLHTSYITLYNISHTARILVKDTD